MRVIIADDSPIFRDYCTKNLTRLSVDIVAEAASPGELRPSRPTRARCP